MGKLHWNILCLYLYLFSLPVRWQFGSYIIGVQHLEMYVQVWRWNVWFREPNLNKYGPRKAQKLKLPLMEDVNFEAQWPKQQLHFDFFFFVFQSHYTYHLQLTNESLMSGRVVASCWVKIQESQGWGVRQRNILQKRTLESCSNSYL